MSLKKTTASRPETERISSSLHCKALTIQLGEGTNRSKVNELERREASSAILRPKYTLTFPGCFLRME